MERREERDEDWADYVDEDDAYGGGYYGGPYLSFGWWPYVSVNIARHNEPAGPPEGYGSRPDEPSNGDSEEGVREEGLREDDQLHALRAGLVDRLADLVQRAVHTLEIGTDLNGCGTHDAGCRHGDGLACRLAPLRASRCRG